MTTPVRASPLSKILGNTLAPHFTKIFSQKKSATPKKSDVTFSNGGPKSVAPYKHNAIPELPLPSLSTGLQNFANGFERIIKAELWNSSRDQESIMKRWSENEREKSEKLIQSIPNSTWTAQLKSPFTMGILATGLVATAIKYYPVRNGNQLAETLKKGVYPTILGASSVMSGLSGYKTKMIDREKTESDALSFEMQKDVEQSQQQLEELMKYLTDSIRKFLTLQREDAAIKSKIMARGA
ncbi:MAG: hypothetical protein SNF33_02170 [Candidatus Algichlamydia australiensis]|nr:hypothetical protein [Chlamydiales bacterium]